MDLDRKRIILTGASSGIGAALLEQLLEHDVTVVVGDLTPKKVKKDKRVVAVECDVSSPRNVDRLFKTAIKEMGGVDIFIANAGFPYYEQIREESWEHIDKIFSTNVFSPLYALEKMAVLNADREYIMVITASAMAKAAMPGYALYSATKAALDSFATAYRYEHFGKGRLTLVYPIATKTEFFKAAGKSVPVPWPRQKASTVAKAIICGIKRNKKRVFPSKIFYSIMILDRLLPFTLPLYAKVEQWKLKRWLRG